MEARNSSAAQWWIWRMTSPARTSKLSSSAEWYASVISTPRSGP